MRNTRLKSITLTNFKGAKNLTVEFGKITSIFGRNATGKSTLFDAFTWCLFGKDSHDNKDFEIKPLDENGQPLRQVENEVALIMEVAEGKDVRTHNVRHIHKEKWVKKRGTEVAEFSGNTHEYFWNDVPMQAGEFQAKVDSLINESLFKLITSPHYFNAMKWQDRRKTLMSIAGEISAQEIIDSVTGVDVKYFNELIDALNQDKTIAQFKAELAAKRKKLKEELDRIPVRIDEVAKNTPEVRDWNALQVAIDAKKARISEIDNALTDVAEQEKERGNKRLGLQRDINDLKMKIQSRESEIRQGIMADRQIRENELKALDAEINNIKTSITAHKQYADRATNDIAALDKQIIDLRQKYADTDAKVLTFDDHQFNCPTCLRALDASDIDAKKATMTENFNSDKARKLESINTTGRQLKADKAQAEQVLEASNATITERTAHLEKLTADFHTKNSELTSRFDQESIQLAEKIAGDDFLLSSAGTIRELTDKLNVPSESTGTNTADLKGEKAQLMNAISDLSIELNKKLQIEQAAERRKQLEAEQQKFAQELAGHEKAEFAILQFEKAEVDLMESRINGKFRYARFKMFNTLVNGASEPCCETTFQGVPYNDLNTAAKMMVGIDIINVLSEHYQVTAPIFLDNRESVTAIPLTGSQIINLIVSPNDPVLRVAIDAKETIEA